MKKNSLFIILCLLITGCSVKKEGVFLGSVSHDYSSIESRKCQLEKCPESVVLIGTVSAYRTIGKKIDREYQAYSKAAKKFLVDSPINLTSEEFEESVKGWTMLQTYNIPLIGASYSSVFISTDESVEINYASDAEAFLVQGTADLVSAKSNADGLFFLEKRLCDSKKEYATCKKKYRRGIFNAKSGKELNRNLHEKKNAKAINIQTYEVLDDH